MTQREKLIEIIKHGIPQEVAELKADEILRLFNISGNEVPCCVCGNMLVDVSTKHSRSVELLCTEGHKQHGC